MAIIPPTSSEAKLCRDFSHLVGHVCIETQTDWGVERAFLIVSDSGYRRHVRFPYGVSMYFRYYEAYKKTMFLLMDFCRKELSELDEILLNVGYV